MNKKRDNIIASRAMILLIYAEKEKDPLTKKFFEDWLEETIAGGRA